MKHAGETPNESVVETLKGVVSEQQMRLEDVLFMCQQLGHLLHAIPKKHRQLTVSRMLEHANALSKQNNKHGALMFMTVAASGEYFGQDPDNFRKTMEKLGQGS